MNYLFPIGFYVPRETLMHRLHILGKVPVISVYIIDAFYSGDSIKIVLLLVALNAFLIIFRLPTKNSHFSWLILVLLITMILTGNNDSFAARSILAIGKILCLSATIGLFTMTTQLNSVFQYINLNTKNKMFRSFVLEVYFLLSTTLSIIPSVQYDLQKAIDSETIRMGKRVGILSVGSWVSIFVVILTRTLSRTERYAETVMDRGYDPSQGISSLTQRPFSFADVFLMLFLMTPGLIIWIFPL